jgi:hypothetical protein
MARNGDGATPWLAVLVAALVIMIGLAGWLVLYEISARETRVALNAPAMKPLPGLPPRGPNAPPVPVPRPPS